MTRGILLFENLELVKEYGSDENIFYDEAFNHEEDPSFEKDEEEGNSVRVDTNTSISGYFINNE